jgi:putative GTP pyrophosphokinase
LAETRYEQTKESLRQVLNVLSSEIQRILELEGIHVTVRARLKSFESYYRKLIGKLHETRIHGRNMKVNDLLGIRVICPFQGDLRNAESALRQNYSVLEVEYKGRDQSYREFGYDSIHLLLRVPERILSSLEIESEDFIFEVQVRTILQEAWAEIEHELVYKAELTPLDEPLKRKLASLKATLTLSDNIFQEIRDYQRQMQDKLRLRKTRLWDRILKMAGWDSVAALDQPRSHSKKPAAVDFNSSTDIESDTTEDIDAMLLKALSAHNRQEMGKALELYTRILAHDLAPKARTIVLLHRGVAFFLRGDPERAYSDFTEALRLGERSERAYYFRGIAGWALGQHDEALTDLSESLKIDPLQTEVLFCRALLRSQRGDSAGALADTEQVLAIDPDSAEATDLRDLLTEQIAAENKDSDAVGHGPGPVE